MVTQTKDTILQARIIETLRTGEQNAVKMRELKAMLGSFNDRRIRLANKRLEVTKVSDFIVQQGILVR